ncbi:hypothetical protein KGF57_004017 [Candida theae]|uniref:Uncharacterized protein n=1 Tax=Candida theae TaxID=1198502 RepID=A0AAD5BBX6_9ASCO|nr:uncharacterized protein KGF57_004017 [Candida theae]KAI5953025.1 hypothetical protein KGF57_004017 [Candida theae]
MSKRKIDGGAASPEVKTTKKPTKQQPHQSISICIPSSVISAKNAYNLQQKTMIAYQIAKACLIYDVAEIVVLKQVEKGVEIVGKEKDTEKNHDGVAKTEVVVSGPGVGKKVVFSEEDDDTKVDLSSAPEVTQEPVAMTSELDNQLHVVTNNNNGTLSNEIDDALLLASLLQFFITPPYLTKTMFSPRLNPKFATILSKFKYASKLPKIPSLPFMQNNNVHEHFKEGVIIPRATPKIKTKSKSNKNKLVPSPHKVTVSKYVNIGESEAMKLDIARELPVYSRVTVDVRNKTIVSAKSAYGVHGHRSSFGYHVRMVNDVQFNKLFTNSPLVDGYSETIFVNCDDYFDKWNQLLQEQGVPTYEKKKKKSEESGGTNVNVLMILGNLGTIQRNFECDEAKEEMFEGLESVVKLFDYRLDIPNGCKIEDAILIALTRLQQ